MAGAWGRSLKARAMGYQVAPMTLKLSARVSSPLPVCPTLCRHLICNFGIQNLPEDRLHDNNEALGNFFPNLG
jgi:hypothetical protein